MYLAIVTYEYETEGDYGNFKEREVEHISALSLDTLYEEVAKYLEGEWYSPTSLDSEDLSISVCESKWFTFDRSAVKETNAYKLWKAKHDETERLKAEQQAKEQARLNQRKE